MPIKVTKAISSYLEWGSGGDGGGGDDMCMYSF